MSWRETNFWNGDIGAATSENVRSDKCAQRRLRSACSSAQSDQSLRCPHEETLNPSLSKMRPVKIQIRLRECTGWSESRLGAHFRRYVFWHCGSFLDMPTVMRYASAAIAPNIQAPLLLYQPKCSQMTVSLKSVSSSYDSLRDQLTAWAQLFKANDVVS